MNFVAATEHPAVGSEQKSAIQVAGPAVDHLEGRGAEEQISSH